MQQITPIEIRQKRFEKSFRGYSTDEVDAFLHSLAYVWEKLLGRIEHVEKSLEDTNKEVKRLHGIENAILQASKDAEINARNTVQQAQEKATMKLQEVNIEAAKQLQTAQKHIKSLEEEGLQKLQLQEEKIIQKLAVTQKTIQEIEAYKDTLLQKIRYLAEDILVRVQVTEDKATDTVSSDSVAPSEDPVLAQHLSFASQA